MHFVKHVVCSLLAVFLVAAPASAADNELGLGFGESTGIGVLYQRQVAPSWWLRGNLGVAPTTNGWTPETAASNPAPFTWVFAGGGVARDLFTFPGGRGYALCTALYKQVSAVDVHRSLTPGVGVQWGPVLLELGLSFYDTHRSADRFGGTRVTWGHSLSSGLGLVWGF